MGVIKIVGASGGLQKPRLKMIQYSESKAGKSYRAATAAIWGPVLFLDFDLNFRGRTERDYLSSPLAPNIHYAELNTFGPFADVEKELKAIIKQLQTDAKAGKPRYATVVIDTWTAFEHMIEKEVRGIAEGLKMSDANQSYWGKFKSACNYWIQTFFNGLAPYNVIINCHTKMQLDAQVGVDKMVLLATGQVANELDRFCEERHFLDFRNNKRTVRVVSDHKVTAYTTLKPPPKDGLIADLTLAPFSAHAFCLKEGEGK